jgi:hypothetical protein
MTTDRELLELAAKAAGIPLKPDFAERYDYYIADPLMWNPLTDDGDALRLAVKLGIHISPDCEHETSEPEARAATPSAAHLTQEKHKGDRYTATRRAIVRAAAALAEGAP